MKIWLLLVKILKVIPCGKRVFTHTRALSELSCVFEIFYDQEKYLCYLKSQLSFISLFSFEMLSDCIIN
jgi:hypothetical protein